MSPHSVLGDWGLVGFAACRTRLRLQERGIALPLQLQAAQECMWHLTVALGVSG